MESKMTLLTSEFRVRKMKKKIESQRLIPLAARRSGVEGETLVVVGGTTGSSGFGVSGTLKKHDTYMFSNLVTTKI